MPQNPDFSRKMMGFDGGGLGLTSATLRCTSKTLWQHAVGFLLLCRAVSSNSYTARILSNRKERDCATE